MKKSLRRFLKCLAVLGSTFLAFSAVHAQECGGLGEKECVGEAGVTCYDSEGYKGCSVGCEEEYKICEEKCSGEKDVTTCVEGCKKNYEECRGKCEFSYGTEKLEECGSIRACEEGLKGKEGVCVECGGIGEESCEGVCDEGLEENKELYNACAEKAPACASKDGKTCANQEEIDKYLAGCPKATCGVECGGLGEKECVGEAGVTCYDSEGYKGCSVGCEEEYKVCEEKCSGEKDVTTCVEGCKKSYEECGKKCESKYGTEKLEECGSIRACEEGLINDGKGICNVCGGVGQLACPYEEYCKDKDDTCNASGCDEGNQAIDGVCMSCGGLNEKACGIDALDCDDADGVCNADGCDETYVSIDGVCTEGKIGITMNTPYQCGGNIGGQVAIENGVYSDVLVEITLAGDQVYTYTPKIDSKTGEYEIEVIEDMLEGEYKVEYSVSHKVLGISTSTSGLTIDHDCDNDGLTNFQECTLLPLRYPEKECTDTDDDGIANYLDVDSDDDTIPDLIEVGGEALEPRDTDKDDLPDYLDPDSDNDTIPDSVEAGSDPEKPIDTDEDNIPDYLDVDSDNDTIPDSVEAGPDPEKPIDTDEDNVPDYQDTNSDNDFFTDEEEYVMSDNDAPLDTDKDGIPDQVDADDGDNVSEEEELGSELGFDVNQDGFIDAKQENVMTAENPIIDAHTTTVIEKSKDSSCSVDNNQVLFYLEPELGTEDSEYDYFIGLHGFKTECGNPGETVTVKYYRDQVYDTSKRVYRKYLSHSDTYIDFDDQITYGEETVNGIAVTTVTFSITDGGPYDSDGEANGIIFDPIGPAAIDSDEDGIPNDIEGSEDSDQDGTPDYLDTDSDNDGIPDQVEVGSDPSNPIDTDGDAVPDYLDTDSDDDGYTDSQEAGSDPTSPVDTDNDATPDYLDTDSDNGGLIDSLELSIGSSRVDASDDIIPTGNGGGGGDLDDEITEESKEIPDEKEENIENMEETDYDDVIHEEVDIIPLVYTDIDIIRVIEKKKAVIEREGFDFAQHLSAGIDQNNLPSSLPNTGASVNQY